MRLDFYVGKFMKIKSKNKFQFLNSIITICVWRKNCITRDDCKLI